MIKNLKLVSLAALALVSVSAFAANDGKTLAKSLKGVWVLKEVDCNGVKQDLGTMYYTLSFDGKKGAYISKNDKCQQVEPEIYNYVSGTEVTIKQGVRACTPSPCEADLPATQCGKETNPQTPKFDVAFKEDKSMVLSTNDPKSVDCIGTGQSKPAVFVFVKK